jgi:hypothetical protein
MGASGNEGTVAKRISGYRSWLPEGKQAIGNPRSAAGVFASFHPYFVSGIGI